MTIQDSRIYKAIRCAEVWWRVTHWGSSSTQAKEMMLPVIALAFMQEEDLDGKLYELEEYYKGIAQ